MKRVSTKGLHAAYKPHYDERIAEMAPPLSELPPIMIPQTTRKVPQPPVLRYGVEIPDEKLYELADKYCDYRRDQFVSDWNYAILHDLPFYNEAIAAGRALAYLSEQFGHDMRLERMPVYCSGSAMRLVSICTNYAMSGKAVETARKLRDYFELTEEAQWYLDMEYWWWTLR